MSAGPEGDYSIYLAQKKPMCTPQFKAHVDLALVTRQIPGSRITPNFIHNKSAGLIPNYVGSESAG